MINHDKNCNNKNCEGGVITTDGQSGALCKSCNPSKNRKPSEIARSFSGTFGKMRMLEHLDKVEISEKDRKRLHKLLSAASEMFNVCDKGIKDIVSRYAMEYVCIALRSLRNSIEPKMEDASLLTTVDNYIAAKRKIFLKRRNS